MTRKSSKLPETAGGGRDATNEPAPGPGARFERYGLPTAVLDVHEAAAYLAVTSGTVYRLVRSGELAHVRIGRSVRFRVADLDAYLAERTSREWNPHGHETRARGRNRE
jgi:excisionase family DNA binding protein